MIHKIPYGTSEPQDFSLKNDGAAFDGSDFDVTLEIYQRVSGVMVALAGPPTAAWLSDANGTVRVTGTEALALGSYFVRYKVESDPDNVGYFPNGANPQTPTTDTLMDVWVVAL